VGNEATGKWFGRWMVLRTDRRASFVMSGLVVCELILGEGRTVGWLFEVLEFWSVGHFGHVYNSSE